MAVSHNPRTMKMLVKRELAWHAKVVEKWNAHANIRQDLFGWMDILAFGPNDTLGVQVCSRGSHSTRKKKILALGIARDWCFAKRRILLISWVKKGRFWEDKIEELTKEDFDAFRESRKEEE